MEKGCELTGDFNYKVALNRLFLRQVVFSLIYFVEFDLVV